MNTPLDSLKKSYNNCKKGNWDTLPKEDIDRMLNYQREKYYMNEENMTFSEAEKFGELFNKLIDECSKRKLTTNLNKM